MATTRNIVIIPFMQLIRFIVIALLLFAVPSWATPKAQYKIGNSTNKKWSNYKSANSTKKVKKISPSIKSSKTTSTNSSLSESTIKTEPAIEKTNPKTSAPKYRLSLPPVPLRISYQSNGRAVLNQIPRFDLGDKSQVTGETSDNEIVYFTLEAELQRYADRLIQKARAPHIAMVVMQPSTGKILAIAEKSSTYNDLSLHSGFPAASLFKVITAAAAVEQAGMSPMQSISFRGGNYTLSQWNFNPDPRKDQRQMSAAEALGRSCNPVFGRIALNYLNAFELRNYARLFAFNEAIPFEAVLPQSSAFVPVDAYELSRTAAGFGAVRISPVHAATIMSAIANQGLMPQPILIEKIVSENGEIKYRSRPTLLKRTVRPETARTLLNMMEYTTTIGTSRREFGESKQNKLKNLRVAAKTGTLRGDNPSGLNHWFIATAPIENPKVAVAIVAVDGGGLDSKPSHLGRLLMEKYILG
ncbi:MAG: hypothetical protein GYA55_04945 [SAR324 cluster bacterium]|uniref:Penicillin-binding protein transpeptidase domain-containing protein n=1 Tax=SAR324 cluster bacterium TaxID=2024889 RepID=A0A7X9FQT8_9DELT|nr:hypothetical protein [SAR324 cluster bacterium]